MRLHVKCNCFGIDVYNPKHIYTINNIIPDIKYSKELQLIGYASKRLPAMNQVS